MPQIKNTFLKSKMNKDLDARLIPNGEYRDAQNLQISRSAGDSVGEFENILSNQKKTGNNFGFNSGASSEVIGQYTDEYNDKIYVFITSWASDLNNPRDITAYSSGAQSGTTIILATSTGTVIDPQAAGIQNGMLLRGETWNAAAVTVDPVVTNVTATNITIDKSISLANLDKIVFGFANMIYEFNSNGTYKILVSGSFLNFSKKNPIYGVNKLDDLLFWTDNRNQPRKINVTLANPTPILLPTHYQREDQISVAKYYPYETPLVLTQNILNAVSGAAAVAPLRGYNLTMTAVTGIKIGDIVSGLENQNPQDLWEVIAINGVVVTIYNNFIAAPTAPVNRLLTFSRPTMTNESDTKNDNGFDTTVFIGSGDANDPNNPVTPAAAPFTITAGTQFAMTYNFTNVLATADSPSPTPKVGDYITSDNFTGNFITDPTSGLALTIADEVIIQSVITICLQNTPGNDYALVTLTKDVRVNNAADKLRVGANPNYNSSFTGDEDLIEEKFIRFSYRFKYEDNEYSLAAPFSQICFIPKQDGQFGWGISDPKQDMDDAFKSSVVEWFENRIDSVVVKIPLPDGGTTPATALTALTSDYKIVSIDILYKESDALSTKVVKTIQVGNIVAGDIEAIPSTSGDQFYYNFDYKSTAVFKTLSTREQSRVYDAVPIKALAQEISGNRVIYGNFVEKHTPPENLDYSVVNGNKSVAFNNYAQYPNHSVKQNRNYQVGFVLSDRVGRASSVVLSLNDDIPNIAGSTLYVPYKSWDDVQATALSTYKWLGNSLNLTINNNTNISVAPTVDGQPGLYKSYIDSSVDSIGISVAGSGYAAGTTYSTTYNPAIGTPQALGSGLTVKVVTIGGGGAVTSVEIVNPGTGYIASEKLQLVGGGNDCVISLQIWDANPLGWQSYKFVIKQQEQEYYNAYLPGYIAGYPVTGSQDVGRVAFTGIIGDNINKLPRDLQEVGPLQSEFSSSVRLYGRVNNPDINNRNLPVGAYAANISYLWNTQYFPTRSFDEITTIGPAGVGGLEIANSPFSDANASVGAFVNPTTVAATDGRLPWGLPGASQNFYNVEENPLAGGLRVGVKEAQPQLIGEANILNTLGARVSGTAVPIPNPEPYVAPATSLFCMEPFLSVSETEPVQSNLEIFYESSTSENFVDLYKQL